MQGTFRFSRVGAVVATAVVSLGTAFAEQKVDGVVMAKEQSAHFDAVVSQLEMGGLSFSYQDKVSSNALLTGGVELVVEYLNRYTDFKGVDAKKVSDLFGLEAVKATGSSVSQQGEYIHYRTFNYMPEAKSLYVQSYLDDAPSKGLKLAPEGADLVLEMHMNGTYGASWEKRFLDALGPKLAVQYQELQKAQQENPLWKQYNEVVKQIDSRMTLVLDLSPEGFEGIPGFPVSGELLCSVSNAEVLWENVKPLLEKEGLKVTKKDGVEEVVLPAQIPSWQPLLQYDAASKDLYVASSTKYLQLCQDAAKGKKDSLEDDAHFKKVAATLPKQFSGLAYVSPVFAEKLLFLANAFVLPQITEVEVRNGATLLMEKLSASAVTKVATVYVASLQEKGTLHVVNTPVEVMTDSTVMTAGALVGVSTLFTGANYYRESANDAACEINRTSIEKAVQAVRSIKGHKVGDPLTKEMIFGKNGPFEDKPICPRGGEYILSKTYKEGDHVSCSHCSE